MPISALRGQCLLTRRRSEHTDNVTRFKNLLMAYFDQVFLCYGAYAGPKRHLDRWWSYTLTA